MSIEMYPLREHLQAGIGQLETITAALFTTYTFTPEFFEQNVLPLLFGIEGDGRRRRSVQVNVHLAATPVAVFYDMGTQPRSGGEFRYQHVGIRLERGGVFHPKLVIVAGRDKDDNPGVFVCVSSANLTMRGWGHNMEAAGAFWVETEAQRHELWELCDFLQRMAQRASMTEGRPEDTGDVEAVALVRRVLRDLDVVASHDRDHAAFHCFGLRRRHEATPAEVITPGRRAYWSTLTSFAPYWSSRDDVVAIAERFRTRAHELVPAPKATGDPVRLGIAEEHISEHAAEIGDRTRFRHAKLYVAVGELRGKRRARLTVGSPNFTVAALGTETRPVINVEATVSYEGRPRDLSRLIPDLLPMSQDFDASTDGIHEEETARFPFSVFVAYDWPQRHYRVCIADVGAAHDFQVALPNAGEHPLAPDVVHRIPCATGPLKTRMFSVSYLPSVGATERLVVHGLVTEFGLDATDHDYTPALALDDFFASWVRTDRLATFDAGPEGIDDDEEAHEAAALPGATQVATDQLDATNLFEIYRAIAKLEEEHLAPALRNKEWALLRQILVARPDSIDHFARILDKQTTQLGVRLALLLECQRLFDTYGSKRVGEAVARGAARVAEAVASARNEVLVELRRSPRVGKTAASTLAWFEQQLKEAW